MSISAPTRQPRTTIIGLWRLLRVNQWVKNFFVLVAIFFSPHLVSWKNVGLSLVAFCVFCLFASANYAVNDYLDRAADRSHPVKRSRPLASGAVPPRAALGLAAVLALAGFGLAALLPWPFVIFAGSYLLLGQFYSLYLKKISIVDVITIMIGFVLRLLAGAAAIEADPSIWIIVMTALLALFLALGKRRDDIVRALTREHRASLDGYNKFFLDIAVSIVLGALLVAYLIFTTDSAVIARFATKNLVFTTPLVMAGLLRYLQIILVEERSGSPTDLLLKDRFIFSTVALWVLMFAALMYG